MIRPRTLSAAVFAAGFVGLVLVLGFRRSPSIGNKPSPASPIRSIEETVAISQAPAAAPANPSPQTAPPTPVASESPPADRTRARRTAIIEGQTHIAQDMATKLGLDAPTRERFVTDYLEFIEGAISLRIPDHGKAAVQNNLRQRQIDFEARTASYLTLAQWEQMRILLRSH